MAKPYDATTRTLTQIRPEDWIAFLGLPPGAATLLDTDLSTVSLAADRIIRVDAPEPALPYLLHLEFESGDSTSQVPARLQEYSTLASAKHRLSVVSVVFLLRRASDSPQLTGIYEQLWPDRSVYHRFVYRVVRVWQESADAFLTGGLGLLPLALVANVTEAELPGIVDRINARVQAELPDTTAINQFWTAVYILMGLRYKEEVITLVLQRVSRMKESVTYQAILREGREEGRGEGLEQGRNEGQLIEARRMVLRAGTKRLGVAPKNAARTLDGMEALDALECLLDRVFEWDELLQGLTPPPRRRTKRSETQ